MQLQGRTIVLAEGRQLEDLAPMLEKEGGAILRFPMLKLFDHPEGGLVVAWLRDLCAGKFTHVILLTGEGLRRLIASAERAGIRDAVVAAFGRVKHQSRAQYQRSCCGAGDLPAASSRSRAARLHDRGRRSSTLPGNFRWIKLPSACNCIAIATRR